MSLHLSDLNDDSIKKIREKYGLNKIRKKMVFKESRNQMDVVEWFEWLWPKEKIVHVPNSAKRSWNAGKVFKKMGTRKGFPDLFLPVPKGQFHGFMIEMKVDNRPLKKDQEEMRDYLISRGYRVDAAWTVDEAKNKISAYMGIQ